METGPTPRVSPLEDPSPDVVEALSRTLLRPGQTPLNVFRTLAVHPGLLQRTNELLATFIHHGTLPPRERELVILRVAARVHCQYEWRQHLRISAAAGLREEEISNLEPSAPADAWDDGDRTLIAMTDELIDTDDVQAATWSALRARWDDAQLVELVLLVGCYRMMADLMRTLRIDVDA